MYQTKDNFLGFPMAMFFLMMLAQSYSHSCLSRTQEGWLPHMNFPIPPPLTDIGLTLMLIYSRPNVRWLTRVYSFQSS